MLGYVEPAIVCLLACLLACFLLSVGRQVLFVCLSVCRFPIWLAVDAAVHAVHIAHVV